MGQQRTGNGDAREANGKLLWTTLPMSAYASSAHARPVRGMLFMVIAYGFITINDASMKWTLTSLPIAQAIFTRGLFALLFLIAISLCLGRLRDLRWRNPGAQIACAITFTISMFCFVTSLSYLPLAFAVVIISSGPIYVTVLAPVFLGERVGWWRRTAVLLGFAGTIVVMQPGTDGFSWPMFLPLIAALFNAIREMIIRRVIGTESSISMVLTAMAFVTCVAAMSMPFVWQAPSVSDVGLLALAGASLSVGLVLVFEAIRSADVSIVSPFQYSGILWASLAGFLVWSDVPTFPTALGATLIIAGGIIILWREDLSTQVPQ